MQARTTHKPVVATALTTENSQTTANPNGTLTLTQSAVPSRTFQNGTWTDLDATLKVNPDGTVSPAVTPNSVVLSGGGNGPLASLHTGGQGVDLTLPIALPHPKLSGPSAVYADVLPGVDLTVTVRPTGAISDVFTVHSREAAHNPHLADLLRAKAGTTRGLKATADTDGNIAISDTDGLPLYTAPAPHAWDSAATPPTVTTAHLDRAAVPETSAVTAPGRTAHSAKLKVTALPDAISLTAPTDLFDAQDTAYPVFVDPTYSPNYGNSGWSSPSAAYPTQSYWNNTFDPTAGISQIGNSSTTGNSESMSLFDFSLDPGTFSGAKIYGASFGITETHSWSCPDVNHNQAVDLYAPSATLDSSNATWNSWSGTLGSRVGQQSFAYGYSTDCPAQAIPPFDVSNTIAADVAAGKSVQTLVMRADDGSGNYAFKEFQANTANLTVTYDKVPNTPSGLYTSPATNCVDTTLGDTSVSLYAPVSTPTNSPLTTTFSLYKTSDSSQTNLLTSVNGISSNASTGASGQAAVQPVPESLFKNQAGGAVTSFTWAALTSDGTLASGWSTPCTFKWDPTRPGAPTVTPNQTPPPGTATCATTDTSTSPTQPVGTTCSFTLTPPNGTAISGYQYQVNQSPPVIVNTGGPATINVPLSNLVNTLTVSALSMGGNIGSSRAVWYDGTAISPAAKDGDLTLDGTPDLIVPGMPGTAFPPGLWLATGGSSGAVTQNAVNIGINGLALNSSTTTPTPVTPTDWNGAQAITGNFCGNGAQDVMAYFPTGPNAAGGDIVCNDGSSGPLHLGTNLSTTTLPYRILAKAIGGATPATQITNAGNTSRQGTGLPDLLATINNQLVLLYSTTANGYSTSTSFGKCSRCYTLTALQSPDGSFDWNSWTIATAQLASGTAMYLWNRDTGELDLWTGLAKSTNGTTLTTTGRYTIATNWNTGKTLLLRAADITGSGIPGLWATDRASGTTTTALPAALANSPTINTSATALSTPNHAWMFQDINGNEAGSALSTTADSIGSLNLGGTTGAQWSTGDLFTPDAALNTGALPTTGALTASGPAVDLSGNFTVSAWAQPGANGGVILSQDGQHSSGLLLYPDLNTNQWFFCLGTTDSAGWPYDCAHGGTVSLSSWTHLTATYNSSSGEMAIYINGVEAGSGTHTHVRSGLFAGSFTVGDYKYNDTQVSYFTGRTAQIQTWNQTLTPYQIASAAGPKGALALPSDGTTYPSGSSWQLGANTEAFNSGQLTVTIAGTQRYAIGSTTYPNAVMTLQADGNLAGYPTATDAANTTNVLWTTSTGQKNDSLIFQPDGNLVLYASDGTPLWSSQTNTTAYNRVIEAIESGALHEVYTDTLGWHDNVVGSGVGGNLTALSFAYGPVGQRVIEASEGGALHEIFTDASGKWCDNAVGSVGGNITALSFAYSPTGQRVIEALEGGVLHEIYSDTSKGTWTDSAVGGVGSNITALSFAYSPTGDRVIEAVESGVLHEIYSNASNGTWTDSAVGGVGSNITPLALTYNTAGQRVIEAVEGGVLHEIYSNASNGTWTDNTVSGVGSNITALSVKINPTGDRVIEAVEAGELHEIYSDIRHSTWNDNAITGTAGNATALSFALR